jgi:hypothetical protein
MTSRRQPHPYYTSSALSVQAAVRQVRRRVRESSNAIFFAGHRAVGETHRFVTILTAVVYVNGVSGQPTRSGQVEEVPQHRDEFRRRETRER